MSNQIINNLFFSLIIPTINRTNELVSLLDSLCLQIHKDFEVIIVDQNEDDRVSDLIIRFQSKLKITCLKQKIKGASAARNAGIKISKGSILTFPDDDCEYYPDLLEEISLIFNKNPDLDGITVSSADKKGEGKIARLSENGGLINKFNVLPKTIEFAIFMKRSSMENIFFNEDLGVGSITPWWSDEGPDFVLRIIEKDKKVAYFPNIIIHHPNPVKKYDEKSFIRSYKYGCGRGRFLKIHNYPSWYVLYIWSKYIAGAGLGLIQLDFNKMRYYSFGLKGRIEGYFSK